MNIGITGATGFVGSKLVDVALQRGHQVIAFSRRPERQIPGCDMRRFCLETPLDVNGCEAVVHLAGESVLGVWTAAKMRAIRESRVQGTRRVVEGIMAAKERPEVLVSGSGIGIYREGTDAELTEDAPHGSNFLAETAEAWEAEAAKAEGTRVVRLRIGMVLGHGGGPLQAMAPLFKACLGGVAGTGLQWVSWIHVDDLVMLILFAIENLEVRGPLNAVAPWPVRNREFTTRLAAVLRRPAIFSAPAWALKTTLGEFSRELLDSKRVVPAAATAHGFRFRFPEVGPALRHLFP